MQQNVTKMQQDITNYESLLSEYTVSMSSAQEEHKAKMVGKIHEIDTVLSECKHHTNQVKTMMRNTNHHFTMMNGTLGHHGEQIKEMLDKMEVFPALKHKADQAYWYINKHQPMVLFN